MDRNRSYWDLPITIGIPFSRWGAVPFVVNPVRFPKGTLPPVSAAETEPPQSARQHPFQLALVWQDQLAGNNDLSLARIAERESLSRARVTQIMNLLQLPEAILADLTRADFLANKGVPSERQLRRILALKKLPDQLSAWKNLGET